MTRGVSGLVVLPALVIPYEEIAFSADPSGGPGGQHANRSSTRVELRFNVRRSPSLDPRQRERIIEALGPRLLADGSIRVVSARERSQMRNREAALDRLATLLARALRRPAPRTATRPTRASKEKRVESKKRRATVKAKRRRPAGQEDESD